MISEKSYLPILSGFMYSTIFGFSFMFTKQGLEFLQPMQLLGFRFAFGAIILTMLWVLGTIKINLKGKRLGLLFLLALFQPVSYFIFEVNGLNLISASEAGMMIALIPVLVAVLAGIFLDERPTGIQFFFIVLSVSGVIFINLMKGQFDVNSNILGILLILGAVVSAGFFNILSRKSSLHFKPVEITFVMMWIGTFVFNSIALIQHINNGNLNEYLSPLQNGQVLIPILYLGGLSSVVAFFLVNYTLSRIEASKSAVFANLTTIISVVAGVVILQEAFYWFHFVGGIMILLGVWGTNYFDKNRMKIKAIKRRKNWTY
ncbi:DMT family transporter [Caldisalinibacter kiritimatiensis]|uniref:Permease of the drug/metabolite transporter (DMT) superfamily n=1 Tax=Caldisalinibacter kiritimatiensis TaxID=1304284 RepID=R1CYE1_9FIRM|nr:DMT family transporter [Caldisalinibacter kiritimatiensis]EOD01594.1 Permease of the drug/metabolite transporter (DMT) superfamily [Caldisalinibacter kiritimatiensis]